MSEEQQEKQVGKLANRAPRKKGGWKRRLKIAAILLGILLVGFAIVYFAYLKPLQERYHISNKRVWRYITEGELADFLTGKELRTSSTATFDYVVTSLTGPDIDYSAINAIDAERMRKSIIAGADWIAQVQKSNGNYRYGYKPDVDKWLGGDNFLRQAGTNYSMGLAWEQFGRENHRRALEQGIDWMLTRLRPMDVKSRDHATFLEWTENIAEMPGPEAAYFEFRRMGKMGGQALPILAMVKYEMITGSGKYDEAIRRVGETILYLQRIDGPLKGKFYSFYKYPRRPEKIANRDSNIYPGEAMLALVRLYLYTGDERYKRALSMATDFYGGPYWADEDNRTAAFVPWATSAMAEMWKVTGEPKYADFAHRMTDYILEEQNVREGRAWYGSFHKVPSVNTSSYLEGLLDAYILAKQQGDEALAQHYADRSKMGYLWLMSLQYDDEQAAAFNRPDWVTGGFHRQADNYEVRIDYTQHAISSIIKGLRYIEGVKPEHSMDVFLDPIEPGNWAPVWTEEPAEEAAPDSPREPDDAETVPADEPDEDEAAE